MSQNRHAKSGPLDGLHNPGYSLTGALALGIGLAAPATGHAAPCSPLPFTVSNGFCTLDVNGDAVDDIVLDAGPTFGLLKDATFPFTTDFLVSSTTGFLLQLSPGDHVGAAIFATNSADAIGPVYGPGLWDQVGETAFAGFRIGAGTPGDFNYGWIELERGSLIAIEWVFQKTPNADAVIPVPEPGSLPLVAIGAAGIAALRRRRARAAEAAH